MRQLARFVALQAMLGDQPGEEGAVDPPRHVVPAMIAAYLDVLADMPWIIGTHPWAFADFRTSQSIMRVGSLNLKGVFTRDRRPKEAARMLRRRWNPGAREA